MPPIVTSTRPHPASGAVLGIGSGCIDTFLAVEHLPGPGGKTPLLSQNVLPGGQVASVLVGCSRLGLATAYLLRTGDDAAGARIRATLAAEGVDLTPGRIVAGAASATAYILRDGRGERAVIWSAPPELEVEAGAITPELLDGVAAVFCDGRDGAATLKLARLAHERSIPVIGDLDFWYPHTAALMPWVDHLVVPAEFTLPLDTGAATVVVTAGAAGATGREPGSAPITVPACPVDVVDTTGAGDAYHAGYVYALLQGWSLCERMRFASATAALACGRVGAQAGLPRLDEVTARLRRWHP